MIEISKRRQQSPFICCEERSEPCEYVLALEIVVW
jgi:hypothetical protein